MATLRGIENLLGSWGDDTLTGDANANTIEGFVGRDVLDGGAGIDTVAFSEAHGSVYLTLAGADYARAAILVDPLEPYFRNENDKVRNFENILGGGSDDQLGGDAGTNRIEGGGGADVLSGGGGADFLRGDQGDDRLVGGLNNDRLEGGEGRDTFVFSGNFERDRIGDFDVAGGDVIQFENVFADFNDLMSYAKQSAGDVRITLDSTHVVVLENVQMVDLTAGDFLFL